MISLALRCVFFVGEALSCVFVMGVLFGQQGDSIPSTTPMTILGAFIFVSVSAFALIGWIVRRLFDMADKQGERLQRLTDILQKIEVHLESGRTFYGTTKESAQNR